MCGKEGGDEPSVDEDNKENAEETAEREKFTAEHTAELARLADIQTRKLKCPLKAEVVKQGLDDPGNEEDRRAALTKNQKELHKKRMAEHMAAVNKRVVAEKKAEAAAKEEAEKEDGE